jgi:hypothetical protein
MMIEKNAYIIQKEYRIGLLCVRRNVDSVSLEQFTWYGIPCLRWIFGRISQLADDRFCSLYAHDPADIEAGKMA